MKKLLLLIMMLVPGIALAQEDIVLENEHARIVFDGGNQFQIKSFVMEGVDIAASKTTPPWEIELLGPRGENPVLKPWMSVYDGGEKKNDTAQFTWKLLLEGSTDYCVFMSVSLKPEMEMPEFDFEVMLPEGWTVMTAEYPRIAVGRPEWAQVILSAAFGTMYSAPTSGWLSSEYPSCTGSMQMTMMTSSQGTVFFSTRDKDASQKVFSVGGEGDGCIFRQKTIASAAWTDEFGIFELPWSTVMGFTRDGWEDTALKWYRPFVLSTRWGAKDLKEREIAPWMKKSDVWLRPVGVTEQTMAAVRKGIEFFGRGIGLHWYQWHHNAFDTDYPDYFPEKEGFREMVAESQKLGAHVTPYINGRLWDTGNHTYDEMNGKDASCRKRDGTLYTEVYGSKVINTVTCPSSPIWQHFQDSLNYRILNELGAHGVYIDQIGAAKGEACYASNHSHAPGGGAWWHLSYRQMMENMRSNVYKPGQAVTTEENAECYIDLFDMMLVVNSPHVHYMRMVPLFPLIYSDRCIYSGFTYIPGKINDGTFDYITMKSLLWGSQLGWIDPITLFREENAAQAEFLRELGAFRKGHHDIFEGGRFMGEFVPGGDNPEKDIHGYQPTPLVMGAKWTTTKGRDVYVLVNIDFKSHKVSLPDGRNVVIDARKALKIWK